MLKFLVNVLDQMDLALEHIEKGGVHDARFGLMLTDNAVELVLHQIARDQQSRLKAYRHLDEKFQYRKELEEALGRSFEGKLKYARIEGQVTDEQSRTITIMHSFRNDLYHLGVQYEPILPDLARFYFSTACRFLAGFKISWFSYSSKTVLPDRAKKFFPQSSKHFSARPEDFRNACNTLDEACGHDKATTIDSLADHVEQAVNECSTCLDTIADGLGQRRSRDEVTIDGQTWWIAFTTEGTEFAAKNGYQGDTIFELTDWLAKNYPLRFKRDPVPGWERQVKRLRSTGNPRVALEKYHSFMTYTASFRDALYEGATQVEAEINRQIEMSRGN
ncbi:hypothetical protein [Rhizobium ruizarguesonis]|uniref:hypothetical protein n=1 Tax=Rhizobium ruizarguesonis TaxID=2081791 RepID=UPI0010321B84|nr:hypothetical protein [Rhizobium ruizarguesonis]TBD12767.1 hypothetical protein ELH20_32940 [Rhizobium ruizarguesonis]